ncbi:hypothetical protein V1264_017775 [Littorina saxatilis]|uniref:Ig-like domain-containing protein n=1 Tax=Littorina saxatilis TaxID=31220 RepID=A0AAN9BJC2_9CAEN
MRHTFGMSRMLLFLLCCILCEHLSQTVQLQRCQKDSIAIFEKGRTRINCTGLHTSNDIYWTVSFDNRTEQTLAQCGGCKQLVNNTQSSCPECEIHDSDYSVTRVENFTIIRRVKGDDRDKDGATLKCSEMNYTNDARATCKIRVKTYKLPQCQDGQLTVSDASPWTSIRCEDSDPGHRVNWTITDTQGNVTTIATCDKGSGDYNCTVFDTDFNVTRNDGLVSELKIVKRVREKENSTLACVRRDGAAAVTCRLAMACKFGSGVCSLLWLLLG